MRVQTESHALDPEAVVVLEIIGTAEHFVRVVAKVQGMEWLGEIEEDGIPPDEDFYEVTTHGERRPDKALRGRLFLLFANQDAQRAMLSIWTRWRENRSLPREHGSWKQIFERLRDVRLWGVKDRMQETGVLDDWRERVAHGEEVLPCEIELWHRGTDPQRQEARRRVADLVARHQGRIVTEASVDEIGYHALLVHMPVDFVEPLLKGQDDDIALVQCEQIQFFRASGQSAVTVADDHGERDDATVPSSGPSGSPVVALLDGLPLQVHRRLENRLRVDDPDNFDGGYPPERRRHGTAMASLIVHGDLNSGAPPLTRPLYVRPILRPDSRDGMHHRECVPDDALVVDLVHRAVRRIFEGEGNEAAAAPQVAVINLSIGIQDRPFDQAISPFARLLDWLAWRYKVLFVVSAGNHPQRILLSVQRSDLGSLSASEMQREILRSVAANARHRRLLSPAEAVNALTVGATHDDASTEHPPPRKRDPYVATSMPSPVNALGLGFRRAIKPDVLANGGRVVMEGTLTTSSAQAELEIYAGTLAPGQLVAAPGSTPGGPAAANYSRGTSNAAAMVSRSAAELYETLEELRQDPGGEMIDAVPRAVWLKALLAHGADWGTAADTLRTILDDVDKARFRERVTRLLGYGALDSDRVRECTASRVTTIGAGWLAEDESCTHSVPLAPSLSGWRGHRRLTITLAWLTPVNPGRRAWRRAHLWFSPPKEELGVKRQQADGHAVQRGTVQHEVLEGESSRDFGDSASLEIQVNCRADAGKIGDEVPYALVATVEVTSDLWVSNIYDEVRAAVEAARLRVDPARVP